LAGERSAYEWDPKRRQTLSPRGRETGVEGAQPPPRGFGGCAPKIKKKGRVARISNPATSGTQNAGKPKANEGGQRGVQGGQAPWQGVVGGVPPQRQKRERVAHISNPAASGTQNAGKPKADGGGQTGGPGGEAPMAGGCGGVPRSRRLKPASLKKVGLRRP
jgi:hypothetical protein